MAKYLQEIFTSNFDPKESQSFCFSPAKKQQKVIGLICSEDTDVSIAIENGTKVKLNKYQFSYKELDLGVPPSKRVLDLDFKLQNCSLTGVITNRKTVHQKNKKREINLYLLFENED